MPDLDIFWLEPHEEKLLSFVQNVADYDLAMEWYHMISCIELLDGFEPYYDSFLLHYLLYHLDFFQSEILHRFYELYKNTGDEEKISS